MKYRLTEAAKQDVREIVHHIRRVQKSPQNARLVATWPTLRPLTILRVVHGGRDLGRVSARER